MDARKPRRNARRLVIGLAVAASVVGGDAPAPAQESSPPRPAWEIRERARIGVYLEERCEARALVAETCRELPVVASVVPDGPADRAGIRAGDTLLTIGGASLATAAGRLALQRLVAGEPVQLGIGRASGRENIEVVPEMRLRSATVAVRARSGKGVPIDVRMLQIPEVELDMRDLQVRLDSLRQKGHAFVFFHEDSAGRLLVDVGTREIRGEGRYGPPRYLWENEELARRLEAVRDSSLRTARVRLDSLVRLHARLRVDGPDPSPRVERVTARRSVDREPGHRSPERPPVPGELQALFVGDRRVAGAEFRPLEADLAEYFEGAEEGLLVLRVLPGTPAARLGLRGGDVVVEAGGRRCRDVETLRALLEDSDDEGLSVRWIRKGTAHDGVLEDS